MPPEALGGEHWLHVGVGRRNWKGWHWSALVRCTAVVPQLMNTGIYCRSTSRMQTTAVPTTEQAQGDGQQWLVLPFIRHVEVAVMVGGLGAGHHRLVTGDWGLGCWACSAPDDLVGC